MYPVLVEIGGLKLHSYGFFLVVGFFLSTWLSCLEARRRGLDPNLILDMAMPLLLVSLVFCRIVYFVVHPDQWAGWGEFFKIWNGGLSVHGGFLGVLLVFSYFAWRRRVAMAALTDIIWPSVFLGYAIGRIGGLMNGCCYGAVCNLPWAIRFPDENNRAILTPPSHPAQLYSTLMALAIFAFIWKNRANPKFNQFRGQLTLLVVGFYAVERFVMEIFRTGATAPMAFSWLTLAQLVSVIALFIVGAVWIWRAKIAKNSGGNSDSSNPDSGVSGKPQTHVSAS